jgi:3-methyladenine DNA glycosylase AlkC
MGAFRAVSYSKKELDGLSAAKRARLKKAIVRHLETHKGIRKIVRQKTRTLYTQLKAKA